MTLNRRYLRNMKHNLSFYICVILLTVIIIVMYISFTGAFDGEGRYLDDFYKSEHVEDAQFVTAKTIPDGEVTKLQKKYEVELEQQNYADMDLTEKNSRKRTGEETADEYKIRIFNPSEKIDTYRVLEGRDVKKKNEILLNPHFLEARKLKIGGKLRIAGTDYKIVGTMARPDYLAIYKNLTDNLFLFDAFGYGVVNEEAFAGISEKQKASYYTVRYGDKDREQAFRKAIHKEYYTLSYTTAESNVRINVPQKLQQQLKVSSDVVIPLMVVFVMVIIAIVLGRKIKSESRQIGVLSALGYGRGRLAVHYGIFGVIPGVLGAVIGAVIAVPCRDYLAARMFNAKVELLPVAYHSSLGQLLYVCCIPVIAYGLVGVITALRVLRFKTVDLLHGSGGRKKHFRMRMAGSKMKFSTKFKIRSILGNWSRSFIVLFGIAVGGIMMVFCYVCIDSLKNYCNRSVNEVGSYEYEYFLSSIQTEPVKDGAGIMVGTFSVDNYDTNLLYMGMDNNKYMNLKSTHGKALALDRGKHYISAMGAMIYGVEKGDTLTFYDQASLKKYRVTIDDIVQNDSQSILYGNWEDTCALMDVPAGSYNAVMSDQKRDYKESEYIYKITKSELSEQIGEVVVSMKSALAPCILFSVLIIVICVYLMVNMLLSENASSISMLKVLGYENRQINKIMINVYHFLVPIGLVLGSVLGVVFCKANFEASVSAYNTYVETVYGPEGFIKYVLWVLASYVLSLWILGRKVKSVDMVESLKDNRE